MNVKELPEYQKTVNRVAAQVREAFILAAAQKILNGVPIEEAVPDREWDAWILNFTNEFRRLHVIATEPPGVVRRLKKPLWSFFYAAYCAGLSGRYIHDTIVELLEARYPRVTEIDLIKSLKRRLERGAAR